MQYNLAKITLIEWDQFDITGSIKAGWMKDEARERMREKGRKQFDHALTPLLENEKIYSAYNDWSLVHIYHIQNKKDIPF